MVRVLARKRLLALAVVSLSTVACAHTAIAQEALGASANNPRTNFKDTSVLVPPPGVPVAVLEWEDLECPFCARFFPGVHVAVKDADVPLVERDFLIHGHVWSAEAALVARYLHDKVSPAAATEYRREVFASQFRIASRDDLQRFNEGFFKTLGKPLPSPIDPTGELQREIDADIALGEKAGLAHTPTVVVVSPHHWTEVLEVEDLPQAIANEKKRAGTAPPAHHIPTPRIGHTQPLKP